MEAILSLGSNLGDRRAHLIAARDALATLPETRLKACAPLYETEPVEVPEAYRGAAYLNTIAVLETGLSPENLSREAHAIEARLGRRRGAERCAPRCIDIDLIACGDAVRDLPTLRLPHPRALQRRFVCQPLADVRPDLVLPGSERSARAALAALPPRPAVRRAAEQWD
jgi:2-amino-4-hydroxy-6-hydroxymethyldihydropteridine diphosphokinase